MSEENTYDPVTGERLKDWGHRPGNQFPALLARANEMRAKGLGLVRIRQEQEGDRWRYGNVTGPRRLTQGRKVR